MTRSSPELPRARGPLSEAVVDALRRAPGPPKQPPMDGIDLLTDDDAQLALACCYELHYRSFRGVDDGWEWNPNLLEFRARLEQAFVRRLEDEVGSPRSAPPDEVVPALLELAVQDTGPSLSRFIETTGSIEQLREFFVHRSAYQLKEADPHTWMIPRLSGRAKAAAVTIQYDEYGEGSANAMHSELFANTMQEVGLDAAYGAYLDLLPGTTLATGNLVSMFGLHRKWRAACLGHLALFEMTSVHPMGRYAKALRRLGVGSAARLFYEVHVAADASHEQIAQHELVEGLLESEPNAGGMILFGARALAEVERRLTESLLEAWSVPRSSLRVAARRELLAS